MACHWHVPIQSLQPSDETLSQISGEQSVLSDERMELPAMFLGGIEYKLSSGRMASTEQYLSGSLV